MDMNEFKILSKITYSKSLKGEDKLANDVALELKALTLEGKLNAVWFHVPNESVVGSLKDMLRINRKHLMGLVNGAPDFVVISERETIFIELKTDKGRLTESQKMFREWASKVGIEYYIIRNLTELRSALKELVTKCNQLKLATTCSQLIWRNSFMNAKEHLLELQSRLCVLRGKVPYYFDGVHVADRKGFQREIQQIIADIKIIIDDRALTPFKMWCEAAMFNLTNLVKKTEGKVVQVGDLGAIIDYIINSIKLVKCE